MRTLTTLIAMGSLLLGLGGVARAATLSAGPVWIASGKGFGCQMVNVGSKDITDVIVRSTFIGGPPDSQSYTVIVPGLPAISLSFNDDSDTLLGWCEFEFKGGKKNVRATLCVFGEEGCRGSIPAR